MRRTLWAAALALAVCACSDSTSSSSGGAISATDASDIGLAESDEVEQCERSHRISTAELHRFVDVFD